MKHDLKFFEEKKEQLEQKKQQIEELLSKIEKKIDEEKRKNKTKQRYNYYSSGDIAKQYKVSAQKLNKFLESKGILIYIYSGRYKLTSFLENTGLQVNHSTFTETVYDNKNPQKMFNYWTEKGKAFVESIIAEYWSEVENEFTEPDRQSTD